MQVDLQEILDSLTLFEKASLCSGFDFWTTKQIRRLGVPSIVMSDGPHGLRRENNDDDSGNIALKNSFPATAFPPAVNMASTWNPELVNKVGVALGEQCLNQGVDIILGPGTNIKRSPLCGRNFEYFSEDPYLAGRMCIEYIKGVESLGVGTSLKHFAANSQEYLRMTINSVVDQRALREIYLTAFEMAVKETQPATVMCSYNLLNGIYASDSKWLLTDVLRKEWGYKGLVVSDWNAVNNRVAGIKAGMDLEMPSCGGRTDKEIVKAVVNGDLLGVELNTVVMRILELVFKSSEKRDEGYFYNYREGHKLARKVADESMVLLKNQNNTLPLDFSQDFALIGGLAKHSRYQGAGSSRINPFKLVSFTDYLDSHKLKYNYVDGYTFSNDGYSQSLIDEAVKVAKDSPRVLLFVGLTDSYESESYDRAHISLPDSHNKLIEAVSAVNENIIIVLFGGSPVEMPWISKVKTIINAYLPGEASGEALADIIFGIVNPSGRLAETYPVKLSDYIGSQYFKGGPKNVEYRESIFVGYRYYDSANIDVLFPFGYGLSYTQFEYSDLVLSSDKISDDQTLAATFKVKNIGSVAGAEVAQLYVKDVESTIFKANKELKGFKKVFLQPGEEETITIVLDKRSFAYYNTNINDWHVESGDYLIMVGKNVSDICLTQEVYVASTQPDVLAPNLKEELPSYYDIVNSKEIPISEFSCLYGQKIPPNKLSIRGEFNRNTTIGEMKTNLAGKVFMKIAPGIIKGQMPDADITTMLMLQQGMEEMPMRALNGITSGLLDEKVTDGLLLWGNKHRFKGLMKIISGLIKSVKNIINSKPDTRVMLERKQFKEEKAKLKEEQRNAIALQRETLMELTNNIEELKKLNKSNDVESEEIIKYITRSERHIDEVKLNLDNIKENNKDTLEDFKRKKKEELRTIKEEEHKIKLALKNYIDQISIENEESSSTTAQPEAEVERRKKLFDLKQRLLKITKDDKDDKGEEK